jgi:hypothetical protein
LVLAVALSRSALAEDYAFTTMDVPGARHTVPFGINNLGQISGTYEDQAGRAHGFVFSGGVFSTVDVDPDLLNTRDPNRLPFYLRNECPCVLRGTQVGGINNTGHLAVTGFTGAGDAALTASPPGFLLEPTSLVALDADGVPLDVPFSGSPFPRVFGINDGGQLVGDWIDAFGRHGFRWDGVSFSRIDVTGADHPFGINNSGQIVGTSGFDSVGRTRGFLISAGETRFIDVPESMIGGALVHAPNFVTQAHGINNKGEIVGSFRTTRPGSNGVDGFLFSNGLFTRIVVPFPNTFHTTVFGINDKGQLVGTYTTSLVPGGEPSLHGFLATPVPADSTPPIIVPTISPLPNPAGWNKTDVTVSWSVTDPESGIASSTGCETTTLTTETAGTTLTCSATNGAELPSSASVTVKIDKTPPTITASRSPGPNPYGWNNTDVTVGFTCSDGLSGVESCGPTPQVVTAEGAGQSRRAVAVDRAGNSASFTVSGINIDKTPPTLAGLPAPGCTLWPPNHRLVQVATVTATDGLSGLVPGSLVLTATSNEPGNGGGDGDMAPDIVINGSTIQLRAERSGQGTGRLYTVTAAATDVAGNLGSATAACAVPHDQRR